MVYLLTELAQGKAHLALLHYQDGEKRYILHPRGLEVGATVVAGANVPLTVGNSLPLKNIPLGVDVHNVEMHPGKGGQFTPTSSNAAL